MDATMIKYEICPGCGEDMRFRQVSKPNGYQVDYGDGWQLDSIMVHGECEFIIPFPFKLR